MKMYETKSGKGKQGEKLLAAVRGDLVRDELRRKLAMKSPADVPAPK